ncbi:MAG: hypothetical protein ACUVWX_11730 [Kiritimatiellia bacterium]
MKIALVAVLDRPSCTETSSIATVGMAVVKVEVSDAKVGPFGKPHCIGQGVEEMFFYVYVIEDL